MKSWDEIADSMSKVTDKLGMPIDAGIFETVVALNVLDIPTIMSCEGHLDRGLPHPWVDLALSLPLGEYPVLPGSDGKVLLLGEVKLGTSKITDLLAEFYLDRTIVPDRQIVAIRMNDHLCRLQSLGGELPRRSIASYPPEQWSGKLPEYQSEMADFTAFLKRRI